MVQLPKSDLGRLVLRFLNDTHTHTRARARARTQPVGLLWTSDHVVAEADTYNSTQQTRKTKSYEFKGIRTRDPKDQKVSDLRPNGRRDRHITYIEE